MTGRNGSILLLVLMVALVILIPGRSFAEHGCFGVVPSYKGKMYPNIAAASAAAEADAVAAATQMSQRERIGDRLLIVSAADDTIWVHTERLAIQRYKVYGKLKQNCTHWGFHLGLGMRRAGETGVKLAIQNSGIFERVDIRQEPDPEDADLSGYSAAYVMTPTTNYIIIPGDDREYAVEPIEVSDAIAQSYLDVIDKLVEIMEAGAGEAADGPEPSPAERLRELKTLLDDGIITEEEYETKRRELVDQL